MASKKNNKKVKADTKTASSAAKATKPEAKKAAKKASKKKDAKPGLFARAKHYFGSVRTEMKRVVWPTKKELLNYSVAVIVSLIVVGLVIAALDAVISQGLVLFSGLRG